MPTKFVLTGEMKSKVQKSLEQVQIINQNLNTYIQGILDAKGLKGQWELNTQTWELIKKEPPKETV